MSSKKQETSACWGRSERRESGRQQSFSGNYLMAPIIASYPIILTFISPMHLPSRLPIDSHPNPFLQSINPPHISPSGQYSPYNYHNNYVNSPSSHKKQQHLSNSRFDGPTESINLNDNVSFARNFKGRLYNSDPQQQINKQKVQDKYRQELRIQMEDDKRRKAAQKAKEQQEDLKLQKNFYDHVKIEAQKKANKEEPNYFVMRSARGKRKQLKQNQNTQESRINKSELFQASKTQEVGKGDLIRRTLYQAPKIMKRGGYHNHSSLDSNQNQPNLNPEDKGQPITKTPPLVVTVSEEQRISQDLAAQQDRISKLLLFQQNMIRKLDYFKKQIYQTNQSLKLEEQYEKIKLKLRAKPINIQKIYSLQMTDGVEDVLENTDLYKLPVISKHHRKIYEGERQIKKKERIPVNLNDQTQKGKRKEQIDSKQREIMPSNENDKNFVNPPSKNQEQAEDPDQAGIQADF